MTSKVSHSVPLEPAKDGVKIVWFHSHPPRHSHVALSIDDKVYGFSLGTRTRDPESLTMSLDKVGKSSRYSGITTWDLRLEGSQKQRIEQICKRSWFPAFTCMHAVARISFKELGIIIPPLLNCFPEHSRCYLELMEKNSLTQSKILFNRKTVGVIPHNILSRERTLCLQSGGVVLTSYIFSYLKVHLFFLILASIVVIITAYKLNKEKIIDKQIDKDMRSHLE